MFWVILTFGRYWILLRRVNKMEYAIKILTMELWGLKKRLHDYLILSDEFMSEHPAIKETKDKIIGIEKAIKALEE